MNRRLCGLLTLFINCSIGLAGKSDDISALQGECRDGTFGYKCTFRCRCKRFQTCDKVNGKCFRGCADGYWGPGCQLSNNCFYNGQDKTYMGTKSVTDSLIICQRWDSEKPHRHSYVAEQFPDRKLPEHYCRSTDDSSRPWCYTTDENTRWEHCNVNNCNCPSGRFGDNCAKECHCADLNEACDSILGVCSSGCAQGWTGYDCQQPVACPLNRFGWDCSKRCFCQDSRHCKRFTGPTKDCRCVEGYFNPPFCQAVTPPKLLHFSNVKVNPKQNTTFNCTVTAYPPPRVDEIKLRGPSGRRITLSKTGELEIYMYTRYNVYDVEYVEPGDRFTCISQSTAGKASKTVTAAVYELPVLSRPPTILEEGEEGTSITVQWNRWDRKRGDKGDPPIVWYQIMVQVTGDYSSIKMAGITLHMKCPSHSCSYIINDLLPNTEYTVRIATKRDGIGGEGPLGPALYIRTHCGVPKMSPILQTVSAGFEYNSSFPETQLIVMWRDPPKASWNCDTISSYQIFIESTKRGVIPRAMHVSGGTAGDANDVKSASISDLEPSTEYCVRMSFQNTRSHYSPESINKCATTPNTTPTAPVNLRLKKKTSRSLTITWEKPLLPPATIKIYRVAVRKGELKELNTKLGQEIHSTSPIVDFTLDDLEPFTKYQIQVRAVTSAGIGDPSDITVITEESIPGPITTFRNTSKTARSLSLRWGEPSATNGELINFMLACLPVRSMLSITDQTREASVEPYRYSHTFTNLTPATKYVCSVNATTRKGAGPSSTLAVWTSPLEPKEPPAPNILERTDTTITIRLTPLEDNTVSFYRIIVENISGGRSKRSIPESIRNVGVNYHQARASGSRAYIAAELNKDQINDPFIVGDNKTYGGYDNVPLVPTESYDIWFGAFSNVDGTQRKSFSKAESSVVGPLSVAPHPDNNHVPVIIVVLVVFILLILVFALLLFLWRKRHIASEREKAEMPNFGPTIIPEPETSTPSTPVDDIEIEPLIEPSTGTPTDNECDPLYGNTGLCIIPPVKVEDLWDYVKQNKENEAEGLRREYRLIPAGLTASCEVAKKTDNKIKNRYGNIIAYDHTRVVLMPVNEDIHDDYTNANYIDGYKKTKAYIAAQGPTKPTIDDIWRMAWQERSKSIIMLTNPTETGKKKCEQYWPDKGKQSYAGIVVELLNVDHLPDFTIRTFQLSKPDEDSMKIKQFHYTTWPDHGVPRFGNSLLLLRQKIRSYDNLDAGPPIVHCSAGVGRTGTYIAVDVNLEQAKNEGIVDVHNFVQLMRSQRVNMVQTIEQYMFVYDALLEALICGDTTISTDKYTDTLSELLQYEQSIGKTKLDEQFDVLRLVTATIERDESTTALRPENIFKNRIKTIVPANRCRPYLMTHVEDYNDYINAIFLNGWRRKDAHIITQMPMPNTVVDFWRLIYDHNSYCIVMCNEIDPNDEMTEQYWTMDTCGEKYGPFIVETTAEIKSDPSVTVRDFTITNTQNPQEVPRVVRQFHFHRWPEMSAVPSSKVALLELLDQVERWQKQTGNKPVTVHCLDGATRSGLFVAASCILERIKWEKEVDVFQAIKQMRLNRPQLIDSIEQYKFCHEIALEYLNSINTLTTFS